MVNLLPEPKILRDLQGHTIAFKCISMSGDHDELLGIAVRRFWNYPTIQIYQGSLSGESIELEVLDSLDDADQLDNRLFISQGYQLTIVRDRISLKYKNKAGFINGMTSIKQLLSAVGDSYVLPLCEIVDFPSVQVRAVAPTFSWYAGYGRIGFDSQLWGYEEWVEFLNQCMDNKINQLNMVMYGYWPFEFKRYPETILRDVPIKIWNAENNRWLSVSYTHPNIEKPYLNELISLAHQMEVRVFAYVGLNSYNGAYSIKHPQARTKPPESSKFLNDFDSLCLSYPGVVGYILDSMAHIADLGFDGFTLEESEEGFWYCQCDDCKARWHKNTGSPVEAKHNANIWLLRRIYQTVRKINPDAVMGIRAFRQPPLEKDPEFLKDSISAMPEDIQLFWAPGLYVPEAEFDKWCNAFGKDRIWGRDTEANAITSTMGRLYRTFKSNVVRYEDEANEQIIETDIRQHIGSAKRGVHGINGFMFEWFGLFMHLFAHGNYGWGSTMEPEIFYQKACEQNFGSIGPKVLHVIKSILTIHESQIPLYTTPFPFQKNKMGASDIPAIRKARANQPDLIKQIVEIQETCSRDPQMEVWLPHFDKILNAQRRNSVIYDLVLCALAYEGTEDPNQKERLLDDIIRLNEADFNIVKEMFFDINPVSETGVKSCMYPYHELKRLIHNIRHPDKLNDVVICSGIEALGWLWL